MEEDMFSPISGRASAMIWHYVIFTTVGKF